MAPAKDARVEKIRAHLRKNTTITKNDFLDFVAVYRYFYLTGFKVRPGLTKWIGENHKAVREWLPEIMALHPGYFDHPQPGSKATTYTEYDTLLALGLVGPPAEPSPDRADADNSDNDMVPMQVKEKKISDFGTPLPEAAVTKRPSIAGQMQQKVWLDDISDAQKHLRRLKNWMISVANELAPHDGVREALSDVASKIPDFANRVGTAQLCMDEVKMAYTTSQAELVRRRTRLGRVSRYSVTPEVEERGARDTEMELASIRVESDITGDNQTTTRNTPRRAAATSSAVVADAPFELIKSPKASTFTAAAAPAASPMYARRSAMPQTINRNLTASLRRKPARAASHESESSGSDESDSDQDIFPDLRASSNSKPKAADKKRSVYSVEESDEYGETTRAKRARIELREANRRVLVTENGGNIDVPEAVMT